MDRSLAQCTGSYKQLPLMTCHVIWEAFAESALLLQRRGMIQKEGRNRRFGTGYDFQKCSVLNGIVIRLQNHVRSGDSQRTGNKWLTFTSDCETAVSLQCFLLTCINMVRSIPRGLRSQSGVCHVPVLSPLSSRGQCSQRGCVVLICWRGTNMRLGCHFYEVFAVSSQFQLRCWANISPDYSWLPVLRR